MTSAIDPSASSKALMMPVAKAEAGGAVEIPRADGSVDVAELWRRTATAHGTVEIPRGDGKVDVAELW